MILIDTIVIPQACDSGVRTIVMETHGTPQDLSKQSRLTILFDGRTISTFSSLSSVHGFTELDRSSGLLSREQNRETLELLSHTNHCPLLLWELRSIGLNARMERDMDGKDRKQRVIIDLWNPPQLENDVENDVKMTELANLMKEWSDL